MEAEDGTSHATPSDAAMERARELVYTSFVPPSGPISFDSKAAERLVQRIASALPPTAPAPAGVEALRSALNEIEAALLSIADGVSKQEAVGKVFAIINSVRATPAPAESGTDQ